MVGVYQPVASFDVRGCNATGKIQGDALASRCDFYSFVVGPQVPNADFVPPGKQQ
jgi:hypothetical protein